MFTFHWSQLLVVAVGGLALFLRLAFLMLYRRDQLIQQFLTPEITPELEDEYFRARRIQQTATSQEEAPEPEKEETAGVSNADHPMETPQENPAVNPTGIPSGG